MKSKDRKLFAVESKRPLAHFDALGLSLAYELGAVNILEMLHLSGVPIVEGARRRAGRGVGRGQRVLASGVHRRADGDVQPRAGG